MKKVFFVSLLLCIGMMLSAQSKWVGFQGFFEKTTAENVKAFTSDRAFPAGVWQARFNTGIEALAIYPKLDDSGKMIGLDPRPFSKFAAGIFFSHTQPTGFQDWSAGLMVTIPNPATGYDKYGLGIGGAYSIFKIGVNYDLGLPFKQGFSVLTGLKIDVFNVIQ